MHESNEEKVQQQSKWGLHLSLMLRRYSNNDDVIWYDIRYGEWLTKYSEPVCISFSVGRKIKTMLFIKFR